LKEPGTLQLARYQNKYYYPKAKLIRRREEMTTHPMTGIGGDSYSDLCLQDHPNTSGFFRIVIALQNTKRIL